MNRVWSRSRLIAYPASMVDFAKVAAPLLAGFALTATVELVGRTDRGVRGELAVLAFALAAALLLFAIQAGLTAASYQASPADRLTWAPEARFDAAALVELRRDQWDDEVLALRYRARARHTYNLGIVAFLLGLLFVLLPAPGGWSVPRTAGIAVVGLAVAVELLGMLGRPVVIRRLLFPELGDLARTRAHGVEHEPGPLTPAELRDALTGAEPVEPSPDGPARRLAEIERRLPAH